MGLQLGLSVCGLLACGGSDDAESDFRGGAPTAGGQRPNDEAEGSDQGDPKKDKSDAGSALPPEREVALNFQTPQAGLSSVYVPNPSTNRVAVVNATTFAIESIPVGTRPTYAATVPGQDLALVLNSGTRDAALLRTEGGKTTPLALPVGHDANAIAIAPDGAHAIIYWNAEAAGAQAQSFQDVTVVNLVRGSERAQRASVGFRPRAVQFSSDGRQAFVVTEDGISILQLTELDQQRAGIARLVPLGDTLRDGQSVDVQVTPDGAYALARREGDSILRLVSLSDGTIESLPLSELNLAVVSIDAGVPVAADGGALDGGPTLADGGLDAGAPVVPLDGGPALLAPELTDLDLAPSGAFALAVLRDRGALVRIPIPQGFRDRASISVQRVEDQVIGSVTIAPQGGVAIGYTTAQASESVVVIDLRDGRPPRGIRLRKSVRAVALSNDGSRALILHATSGDKAPRDEEARIDASEGYSLLNTEPSSGFAKLQLTSAAVRLNQLLITPDATRVFALARDDAKAVRTLDVVDLGSFQVNSVELPRPPASVGFLPVVGAPRVFVGHDSEAGMISFFEASSGQLLDRVAGFEIAGRIRQ